MEDTQFCFHDFAHSSANGFVSSQCSRIPLESNTTSLLPDSPSGFNHSCADADFGHPTSSVPDDTLIASSKQTECHPAVKDIEIDVVLVASANRRFTSSRFPIASSAKHAFPLAESVELNAKPALLPSAINARSEPSLRGSLNRCADQGSGRSSHQSAHVDSVKVANVETSDVPVGSSAHNMLPRTSAIVLQYGDCDKNQPTVPSGEDSA